MPSPASRFGTRGSDGFQLGSSLSVREDVGVDSRNPSSGKLGAAREYSLAVVWMVPKASRSGPPAGAPRRLERQRTMRGVYRLASNASKVGSVDSADMSRASRCDADTPDLAAASW